MLRNAYLLDSHVAGLSKTEPLKKKTPKLVQIPILIDLFIYIYIYV